MSDLDKLQREIIKFRDARDWHQFHTPKDLALSISLEAAELMECFQWKTTDESWQYVKKHKDHVSEEMADVLNFLLIMANDFEIDLIKASYEKLVKNNQKYDLEKSKGNHKKYTEL